ncbi:MULTISPECIES: type 2 isopentenyl-diphosphate Delta-isomerase [unclassified Granulicatella]|uniref:type 2 isopentenyl-diphosphate Delta-isomerase n=1 Tax=unclassified Granulicatella TaxID=2630493 RepID=UPI00107416D7|nr:MULTISPECIES: type 2 isopentenyl-diphosphate Delta-isomerase [unclassified Granulicatella]MBF0780814.1 type 2 isopentenyl-diphosphate Delta-isomerase [Granulicatella sp. 19428wC4_WM01]TFU93800.1 type 2 isopentenyl-diphosphate Delta-isomerase [Granulicatella sp. WM01]
MSKQSSRKDEHIVHALNFHVDTSSSDFSQTRFIHHSFPEINVTDVNLQTTLSPLTLDTPFFINAMTGGSNMSKQVNQDLAILARETHLAMATGSLSIALKDPNVANSFSIARQINPDGVIFANLGAHHSIDNAKKAVEICQADALQIHVNTPQELAMQEGERQFSGWLHNIEQIVNALHVPIIVKEVGFGMSRETVQALYAIGVRIVDVSGVGGTNFAQIEHARANEQFEKVSSQRTDFLIDWGQSTLISLLEANSLSQKPTLIASGGIKNALDIAKCLCLGANAVGISGQILYTLHHYGINHTIDYVMQLKEQLRTIMTLLGAKTVAQLQTKQILVAPSIQNWCSARQIDWMHYANR